MLWYDGSGFSEEVLQSHSDSDSDSQGGAER